MPSGGFGRRWKMLASWPSWGRASRARRRSPAASPPPAALSGDEPAISHYRDKDQVEVDFVLERSPGAVVGIEVKAGATVRPRDFKGLKRLREAAADRFACGIILHDGDRVQKTASRLFAMPVKMLWTNCRKQEWPARG